MYKFTVTLCSFAVLHGTAFAQTKPAFEVATIKPAPPMDQAKVLAACKLVGRCPTEQISTPFVRNTCTWI
jgi:hypothetical protein